MKKTVSVILAIVMMLSLATVGFAANTGNYRPSVTNKETPVVGELDEGVIITPYSDVKADNDLAPEVEAQRDYIIKAYNEVSRKDLSKLNSEVDSSYIVSDFFDITLTGSKECPITVSFKVENPDQFDDPVVMTRCSADDAWEVAESSYDADTSTLTVKFTKLCPVAILVPRTTADGTYAPSTNELSTAIYAAGAIVLAAAAAFVFVVAKKKNTVAE